MTALIAGKWLKLGHYRDKDPVSKNLFLSTSVAFSRSGHKAMFTGPSATPYRPGPAIVWAAFFRDGGRTVFALHLGSKVLVE